MSPRLASIREERQRACRLCARATIGERAVVLLSTHIVDDVDELCSCGCIALSPARSWLLRGSPRSATRTVAGRVWRRRVPLEPAGVVRGAAACSRPGSSAGSLVIHMYNDRPGGRVSSPSTHRSARRVFPCTCASTKEPPPTPLVELRSAGRLVTWRFAADLDLSCDLHRRSPMWWLLALLFAGAGFSRRRFGKVTEGPL